MKIDTEIYRDFAIEIHYNGETKCFYALSKAGNSHKEYDTTLKNFCGGYSVPSEAIKDVKKQIDVFILNTPKDYTELAGEITKSLVWTGYEVCHVDAAVLKILVENFIKFHK